MQPPKTATDVLPEMAGKSEAARTIHDSCASFRGGVAAGSDIWLKVVLQARGA